MTSHSRWDRSRNIRLPKEGHAALDEFCLAPDRLHLNHGSFGAVPRRVMARQEQWCAEVERDPTSFFQDVYPAEIRRAAAVAATCFGGAPEDWVFCENATAAINSVLGSFPLHPGDELVTTSHAYGAVLKAMRVWADRRGARVVVAEIPGIVAGNEQVAELVVAAFSSRTRLLVIDHITSATATIFPIAEIVRAAREHGIATLIDGAHAPGQIPLDVPAIGCDWYTGNAHKWFFAPRGCGLLWTAPARQEQTLPVVLSHGTDRDYTRRFDWVGTRDASPWLCLKEAADAHDSFGGPVLRDRNRALAAEAADLVAGAAEAPASAPPDMRAAMASICLGRGDAGQAAALRKALQVEDVIVPVNALAGLLWLRISAQIYNEMSDYERCADVLSRLIRG
jgi:isopenicillin-N epimerase